MDTMSSTIRKAQSPRNSWIPILLICAGMAAVTVLVVKVIDIFLGH